MEIQELKNRYSGRIFLIGNGPSIEKTPLELLSNEYTFAVNSIPDIFDETRWRPSFYACVDRGVSKKYYSECINLDIPCFFPDQNSRGESFTNIIPDRRNVLFFDSVDLRDKESVDISTLNINENSISSYQDVWSEDIANVVYGYNTIMYHIMQISYYMGFDEMYLVGNDLYDIFNEYLLFSNASDPAFFYSEFDSTFDNKKEFLQTSEYPFRSLCNALAYKTVKSRLFNRLYSKLSEYTTFFGQENYFSEDYSGGKIATHEKNRRHILAHQLAKFVSKELNFGIYNATIGGHLEVHPRVNISDIVK